MSEATTQIPVVAARPPADFVFSDLRLKARFRTVLYVADLSIPAGGVFGVIGPTDSGKSSLLRAIVGLENFGDRGLRRSGKIRISGEIRTVRGPLVHSLRRMCPLIPAHASVFPSSIRRNFSTALAPLELSQTEQDRRISEALSVTGLSELPLNRSALHLAIWERRLLCVARALALEPTALLLDEPFKGLDSYECHRMEQLIAAVGKRATVILTAQDSSRASSVCSRLALLSEGQLVEAGTTSKLLSNPTDPRTEAYLSGRPIKSH
ncbi:MAG: ATP-binding cassette domain-containing protein [Verrucomicrobiales bacterium]